MQDTCSDIDSELQLYENHNGLDVVPEAATTQVVTKGLSMLKVGRRKYTPSSSHSNELGETFGTYPCSDRELHEIQGIHREDYTWA